MNTGRFKNFVEMYLLYESDLHSINSSTTNQQMGTLTPIPMGMGPPPASLPIALTASPAIDVSLYEVLILSPVSFMVLITASRDTMCLPSPYSANRAAFTARFAPNALRSMQGISTNPPTGSHVSPSECSIAISAAFATWKILYDA